MDTKPSEFGMRLKKYIDAKNLTMAELERMAGVNEHIVRKIVNGYTQNTTFETGCRIAMALGITPEELAGLTGRAEGFSPVNIAPAAGAPRWYRMDGDYMKGVIENDEDILVDFAVNEVSTPGVYLIRLDDAEVIRRMATKAGQILLTVSNHEYDQLNEERKPADVQVLGKVIGKYQKI